MVPRGLATEEIVFVVLQESFHETAAEKAHRANQLVTDNNKFYQKTSKKNQICVIMPYSREFVLFAE